MALKLTTMYDFILALAGYLDMSKADQKDKDQLAVLNLLLDRHSHVGDQYRFSDLQLKLGMSFETLAELLEPLAVAKVIETSAYGWSVHIQEEMTMESKITAENTTIKVTETWFEKRKLTDMAPKPMKAVPQPTSVAPKLKTILPADESPSPFGFHRTFSSDYGKHKTLALTVATGEIIATESSSPNKLMLDVLLTMAHQFDVANANRIYFSADELSEEVQPHRSPSKIRSAVHFLEGVGMITSSKVEGAIKYHLSKALREEMVRGGYRPASLRFQTAFLPERQLRRGHDTYIKITRCIALGVCDDDTLKLLRKLYLEAIGELAPDFTKMSVVRYNQELAHLTRLEHLGFISTTKSGMRDLVVGNGPETLTYVMQQELRDDIDRCRK